MINTDLRSPTRQHIFRPPSQRGKTVARHESKYFCQQLAVKAATSNPVRICPDRSAQGISRFFFVFCHFDGAGVTRYTLVVTRMQEGEAREYSLWRGGALGLRLGYTEINGKNGREAGCCVVRRYIGSWCQ